MTSSLTAQDTAALIKILRAKINYRQISAQRPRHVNDADLVLAYALKYIELLSDGRITTWHAENLTYHQLTVKIRRMEPNCSYRSPNSRRERPHARRYLTQTAIELIEYLVEWNVREGIPIPGARNRPMPSDAKEVKCSTDSSGKSKNMTESAVGAAHEDGEAGVADSRDKQASLKNGTLDIGKETFPLTWNQTSRLEEERRVDLALTKIDTWADSWLAGKLKSDRAWNGFEKCLNGP